MGYRSDVMVLIYPDCTSPDDTGIEKYDRLKLLMKTTFREVWEDDFCGEWIDDRQVLKFDIGNVKWYESYPDVRRFEEMLKLLHCEPDPDDDEIIGGYCTEFVRVGEDDNDVVRDVYGNTPHYYLGVHREISCEV